MNGKQQIIDLFLRNVKGRRPDVSGSNQRHDGKEGHWLERQFGIMANGNNEADLFGYELKNQTSSKTTFGDWSANQYIFNKKEYQSIFIGKKAADRRDVFLKIFGKPNPEKGYRYSWSGEPAPKIDTFNTFGQRLVVTPNKDIIAQYSYSADSRNNKASIVPAPLQSENLALAVWYGERSAETGSGKCLKEKFEDKFNQKGWFTCKKNGSGVYEKICFGNPITYDDWIDLVKKGVVIFDSGMHEGNSRPYSEWRADNRFWNSLIVEEY